MITSVSRIVFILCVVLPSFSTQASLVEDDDFVAVSKLSGQCNFGLMDKGSCAAKVLAKEDQRMNQMYQHLLTETSEPSSLKKAQRAWLAFRNAECPSSYSSSTTSPQLLYIKEFICKAALTKQRNRELYRHLSTDCKEYVPGTDCRDVAQFPPKGHRWEIASALPPGTTEQQAIAKMGTPDSTYKISEQSERLVWDYRESEEWTSEHIELQFVSGLLQKDKDDFSSTTGFNISR